MNVKQLNGNNVKNSYSLRIFLLMIVTFLGFGLIMFRLFHLQILNHEYYAALASNQHDTKKTILPKRGEIFLTPLAKEDSTLLVATNMSKDLVYAVGKEIKDPESTAKKLAAILEFKTEDLVAKITSGNQNYLPLRKQLTEEVSNKIKALQLPGIYLEPETIRYYPEENLASQVLGFVGYKNDQKVGQYGIEGEFEKNLAGSEGIEGIEKDVAGRWITLAARSFIPAQDGDDIYLTIDPAIQFKAQQVLKKAVEDHGADEGSVVILNPKTGAVLAMANFPDFDPNEYNKVTDPAIYRNNVISGEYEPGSVFKPLTMAAAINEGKITPETTYTDNGFVQVDDRIIKNSDPTPNGIQTMTQVLEKSLNTGAVFVEQQLGNNNFKKYINKFGFGKLLNIELQGEQQGNIDNLNRKGDVFFATAAYGQGITVTPLQLAAAYTAIANNGKMMKPYIVDRIVHPDGTEEKTYSQQLDQVIDQKTAATVSAMMVNVVENGHGKKAAVKGYYIAGKTGTAQVASSDKAGYDPNKNIGSFVGFGPVDNPEFLMLVRIDNPKDVKFAESTAAPTFGEIASFILNYLQIPPSR